MAYNQTLNTTFLKPVRIMTGFSPDEYLLKAVNAFARRLVVVAPDFRILAAAGSSLAGTAGKLLGTYCYEFFWGRKHPCADCMLPEVFLTGQPVVHHLGGQDPATGNDKILRHLLPINRDGKVEAVAILDQTTGSLKGWHEQLNATNAFLKNLIMSSVDGIIASDMTGRILIFNEAASHITGYPQAEALGGMDIRDIYPDDGAREVMRRLRSDDYGGPGKLKSYRVDLLCKDGTTVPIDLSASVVYDCGREAATVGFFYDLRPKLRMERDLHEIQVQLIQAEKMSSMGKLAAGVAHQLNNPLGGIVIFAQLLLEEYDLPTRARDDVQRIFEDAERCQIIVRELLDFARQSAIEVRPNDINKAISRTVFLLENQPLFKSIDIVTDYDPNLPAVPSDIQQLNHVFMNLILNAADAMEGRGRLRIRTRLSPGGDRVCVEISDTGPGIPQEILPHIFDPFFTTKEEGQGTGLGLSVAYGVIENHRGRITACSAPGEGATFMIELPITPGGVKGDRP